MIFEVFIHKIDSNTFDRNDEKYEVLSEISMNMKGLLNEYAESI